MVQFGGHTAPSSGSAPSSSPWPARTGVWRPSRWARECIGARRCRARPLPPRSASAGRREHSGRVLERLPDIHD